MDSKIARVSSSLRSSIGGSDATDDNYSNDKIEAQYYRELSTKLKEKSHHPDSDRTVKLQILSLLPSEWTVSTIAQTIGTSKHMAKISKNLVKEEGILSTPSPKKGGYNS